MHDVNLILAELTRGPAVESRHRGALAVVDDLGSTVLALGDVGAAVYPRSAVKALQALPLIESGAADRLGLSDEEIALACASHSGSAAHVAVAQRMLAKAGLEPAALECGAHWPGGAAEFRELAASGVAPSALHNNCSGKHAGFLCLACAMRADPRGYVGVDHPVQRMVRAAIEEMTGVAVDAAHCGTDGCSIPTYRSPLHALARAFARFGTGTGLAPSRAEAARRIRAAVAAHPTMVAGLDRFDTRVMTVLGERVFCKVGAEGVYCAAFPQQGLGVALKIDDGAARAAEVALGAMIRRFVPMDAGEAAALAPVFLPPQRNWNGIPTGELRPAG
jgi:L-asparaginase II